MVVLQNLFAVVLGFIGGSFVNMAIIVFVSPLIPLPEGVDPNSMESIKANIDKFGIQNFIAPFAAHALGTLLGAFLTACLAKNRKLALSLVIGLLNMLGGIAAIMMIGGPIWFMIVDLGIAYLPMAGLGGLLGIALTSRQSNLIKSKPANMVS